MALLEHIEFQSLKMGNILMPDEYEHADQMLKKTLLLENKYELGFICLTMTGQVARTKYRLLVFQWWRLEYRRSLLNETRV